MCYKPTATTDKKKLKTHYVYFFIVYKNLFPKYKLVLNYLESSQE